MHWAARQAARHRPLVRLHRHVSATAQPQPQPEPEVKPHPCPLLLLLLRGALQPVSLAALRRRGMRKRVGAGSSTARRTAGTRRMSESVLACVSADSGVKKWMGVRASEEVVWCLHAVTLHSSSPHAPLLPLYSSPSLAPPDFLPSHCRVRGRQSPGYPPCHAARPAVH